MAFAAPLLHAQSVDPYLETNDPYKDTLEADTIPHPLFYLGLRGGVNFSDMSYTRQQMSLYDHTRKMRGMVGIFAHIPLGQSDFSLRPELTLIGRGVALSWFDIDYRLSPTYFDVRLPLTYNFVFGSGKVSPYLMAAPTLNFAVGGEAKYSDYQYNVNGTKPDGKPGPVAVDITKADIASYDIGLLLGAGVDFNVQALGLPCIFSLEAGYHFGFRNTFADRENLDVTSIAQADRSIIANPFFGAELWREKRKNNGIEVAMRIAIPIMSSPKKKHDDDIDRFINDTAPALDDDFIFRAPLADVPDFPAQAAPAMPPAPAMPSTPDTVFVPDTIYVNGQEYVRKECYSFAEMAAFITLGIDISDKRICMFGINFDFDKDKLRPESEPPLTELAMMMRTYPNMKIDVYGHTDSIGREEYNQDLSERRANTVAKFLQSFDIHPSRIRTFGFGESIPLESNSTPEGRFRNRRVEFELISVGNKAMGNVGYKGEDETRKANK